MYTLQKLYAVILNPIYQHIISKVEERLRNAVITICCIFLTGFFIAYYDVNDRFGLYFNHTKNNIICGCVLIILVLFSINGPLEKITWDKTLFYTFFLAGLGLAFISCLHPVGSGYRSFGLMMMVGYPCMYFVWNNRRDYNTLFKRLSFSTNLVGFAFYIYCMKLALNGVLHVQSGRVNAFLFNANLFSMIGMVMICAALYMFLVNQNSYLWFAFSAISYAVGWEIVLLGVSRLSVLVGMGSTVALLIFGIKSDKMIIPSRTRMESYIKSVAVALILIMVIFSGSVIMRINNDVVSKTEGRTSVEATEESDDGILTATERFELKGKDLNGYTAGRIGIWQRYAKHLNLLGNDVSKTDFIELTGGSVAHAHNNFFEYAYRCGVPVSCIHIFLELYTGIICIIFLFSKKYRDPAYYFAIAFMICYAVESMFDIATLPFERQAPFFFYFALIPVFGKLNDRQIVEKQLSTH